MRLRKQVFYAKCWGWTIFIMPGLIYYGLGMRWHMWKATKAMKFDRRDRTVESRMYTSVLVQHSMGFTLKAQRYRNWASKGLWSIKS